MTSNEKHDPATKDVAAGSDADATPDVVKKPGGANATPAPLESGDGEQRDDNIDDRGNKKNGGRQDQPV